MGNSHASLLTVAEADLGRDGSTELGHVRGKIDGLVLSYSHLQQRLKKWRRQATDKQAVSKGFDDAARLHALVRDTETAANEVVEGLDMFMPIAEDQLAGLDIARSSWKADDFVVAKQLVYLCDFWRKVIGSFRLWLEDVANAKPEDVTRLEAVSGLAAWLRKWGIDRVLPKNPPSAGKAALQGAAAGVAAASVAGAAALAAGGSAVLTGGLSLGVGLGVAACWCLVAYLARVCVKASYRALQADCRAAKLAVEAYKARSGDQRKYLKHLLDAVDTAAVVLDQGDRRYVCEDNLHECLICLMPPTHGSKVRLCGHKVCSTKNHVCDACYSGLRERGEHRKCLACRQDIVEPKAMIIMAREPAQ